MARSRLAPRTLGLGAVCLALITLLLVHWNDQETLPAGWDTLRAQAAAWSVTPEPHGPQDDLSEAERAQYVRNLRGLLVTMPERFPHDPRWYAEREPTLEKVRHLADCLEAHTCSALESDVIIAGSLHFGNSLHDGTSGEDIWARSSIDAFNELGRTTLISYKMLAALDLYQAIPKLVSTVILDATDLEDCTLYGRPRMLPDSDFSRNRARNLTREEEQRWAGVLETRAPGGHQWGMRIMEGDEVDRGGGCIRREGYEQGIPLHKTHSFAFWFKPAHPLGRNFTLSPEDYTAHPIYRGEPSNFYLGYSVEKYCQRTIERREQRPRRAYILAKKIEYIDNPKFPWDTPHKTIFADISEKHNMTFLAGADRPDAASKQAGIVNIGRLSRERFWDEVGASRMVVGISRPNLSPTPYESLCLGVPFLNPVNQWDAADPDDQSRWRSQHDGLLELGPPYVYHVREHDLEGFEKAVQTAMETPIEPFIPPRMTAESNRKRHEELLTRDWADEAVPILATLQDDPLLAGIY